MSYKLVNNLIQRNNLIKKWTLFQKSLLLGNTDSFQYCMEPFLKNTTYFPKRYFSIQLRKTFNNSQILVLNQLSPSGTYLRSSGLINGRLILINYISY
jgi:hypothetical protein